VPKLRAVDVMLLATVVLWALNLTVSRYILLHGFQPLSYATVRYGFAAAIFLAVAGNLSIARRDWWLVAVASALLLVNQVSFVYALEKTTAATVGLILGSLPIFAGLIGLAVGLERLPGRFWLGATVSFGGVALVAIGSGGDLSGSLGGDLLGVATAASWAGYSVAIAPLMRRYSPLRISAVVLSLTWVGLLTVGFRQTADQDFALDWKVWALFAFAVLGPLVVTNVLWYTALHRVGPSRATLAANLQPFVAAVFAVILLDEHITAVQIAGGALIAAGILLARRRVRSEA
jgi:drug/metabolite transporter (DMT)-like permease